MMKWTVRILQGLLAVMFLMTGFMKLSGDPGQVDAFTNIYGYGTGAMYAVGIIEIVAAIGLIVGYWKKNLVLLFSGILVVVMAGAVFTHLMAGQGFGVAMMPFILLLLAAVLFLSQRKLQKTTRTV
jgi:putative oxidoreductase